MWLLVLEAYVFLLVAFALGVAVGRVAVRLVVRRTVPEGARIVSDTAEAKESAS